MEAFTLLKSWKPTEGQTPQPPPLPATEEEDTDDMETTDEEEEEEENEPFFDIELTVPEEDEDEEEEEEEEEKEKANESDSEFRFTLSPSTNDPNLVQLELDSSEPNSKPQLTASLLKSATKFRVFISGLNKSNKSSHSTAQNPNQQPKSSESQKKKLFTVKFKVDEVPFASYFTRDNSSKGKNKTGNNKASQKQKKQHNNDESKLHSPSSDEKLRFSKEAIEKYLKKVKPLYIKVSRKYAEKLKFSGQLNTSSSVEKVQVRAADTTENEGKNVKNQKQGTLPLPLPAGLRVVCKRLGKSRSASSSTPSPEAGTVSSRRRDDSITQQQDGIQSAILHCKSSFNSSKEESSQLESSRKLAKDLDDEGGSLK